MKEIQIKKKPRGLDLHLNIVRESPCFEMMVSGPQCWFALLTRLTHLGRDIAHLTHPGRDVA